MYVLISLQYGWYRIKRRFMKLLCWFIAFNTKTEYKKLDDIFLKIIRNTNYQNLRFLFVNNLIEKPYKWIAFFNHYFCEKKMQEISLSDENVPLFLRLRSNVKCQWNLNAIKVSVLMSAYNVEKYIEHSIASIINQTWGNIELIIVDDASTDNTPTILSKIQKRYNNIIVIHNSKNMGAYISRNIALKFASGAYVTCHDADDWAHPSRIERHLQLHLKLKNIYAVSLTKMLRINENGGVPKTYSKPKKILKWINHKCYVTALFNMSFLKGKLGYWDSVRAGGDSEMLSRVKTFKNAKVHVFDVVNIFCLTRKEGLTQQYGRGTRDCYKKNFLAWHKKISIEEQAYMPFPLTRRPFEAPIEILTSR